MSRDLYIYKLKKVGDEIPEVIDYDTEHLPDDYREFGTDYVPRGAEPYGKSAGRRGDLKRREKSHHQRNRD